jgi:hypothetical protein
MQPIFRPANLRCAAARLPAVPGYRKMAARAARSAAARPRMHLLGTDLPILQAPMAGVQAGALAAAVSQAGGLGALPCALLTPAAMVKELELIRSRT